MKPSNFNSLFRLGALVLALMLAAGGLPAKTPKRGPEPILLVVMDPLAKELACACVKGYAQRDYRKLAVRLEKAVKQHVTIEFSDDLAESMAGLSPALITRHFFHDNPSGSSRGSKLSFLLRCRQRSSQRKPSRKTLTRSLSPWATWWRRLSRSCTSVPRLTIQA
jgi:hypothetical protein